MNGEKKSSVLYVLDILREYTDANHSLTYAEIGKKLVSLYDVEIDRKTIARDIDILIMNGHDIVKKGNSGVALLSRNFEDGELLYLLDAIYSSRSMPTNYARDLVNKITSDRSFYDKKRFKFLEKIDDGSRVNNKQIFFTIEMLNQAIEEGKKVELQYASYDIDKKLKPKKDGKVFKINPYFMVNNHGKYYLICNYDKYNNISNWKIENIVNIKILKEDVKPVTALDGQANFDLQKYMQEHIYMLAGKSVNAKIKIDNEERINDVISWFGNSARIYREKNELFVDLKVNEDALIFWALQYGESVEVVAPQESREKMKNIIKGMLKKYE